MFSVVEISYRVNLMGGKSNNSFLRLVKSSGFSSVAARDLNYLGFVSEEEREQFLRSCKGWLFRTGVRNPYCDKEIMKCAVTEEVRENSHLKT